MFQEKNYWLEVAKFWRAGAIAMMTLYCDESDDGHTYALAGWLAVPSAWDHFDPAWAEMLSGITMPDGSPCAAFHAAEIVGRDQISDSKFRGWTFDDEVAAFSKATDLIVDKSVCPLLWPVGVSVELPSTFAEVERNAIWLILFIKMFQLLGEKYPAQRSISFLFDEKADIAPYALEIWRQAKGILNAQCGEEYLAGNLAFDDDKNVMGLQAADFLVYEWRKRVTDMRRTPGKRVRRSYARIREARCDGALWRYGIEVLHEALKADDQSAKWALSVMGSRPTHFD